MQFTDTFQADWRQFVDELEILEHRRDVEATQLSVIAALDEICAERDLAPGLDPEIARLLDELGDLSGEPDFDITPEDESELAAYDRGGRIASPDPDLSQLLADLDALDLTAEPEPIEVPLSPESGGRIASTQTTENAPQPKARLGFSEGGDGRCLVKGDNTSPSQPLYPNTPTYSSSSLNPYPSQRPSVKPKASRKADRHKRAASREKFLRSVEIVRQQEGVTFSLNLSEDREGSLLKSADPARAISNRINRALKAAGFHHPQYTFVLETPTGAGHRLHLHGAIVVKEKDHDRLKEALCKAGGTITGRSGARQIDLRPISASVGWTRYCTDAAVLGETSDFLGTRKLFYLSAPLRRLVLADPQQRPAWGSACK